MQEQRFIQNSLAAKNNAIIKNNKLKKIRKIIDYQGQADAIIKSRTSNFSIKSWLKKAIMFLQPFPN